MFVCLLKNGFCLPSGQTLNNTNHINNSIKNQLQSEKNTKNSNLYKIESESFTYKTLDKYRGSDNHFSLLKKDTPVAGGVTDLIF